MFKKLVSLMIFSMMLLVMLASPSRSAFAAICTTTGDGNWRDPSIWDCGKFPGSLDVAVINHAVTVTSPTIARARTTTINSTGSIINNYGALNYDVMTNYGNIINNFIFRNHGTVINYGVITNNDRFWNHNTLINCGTMPGIGGNPPLTGPCSSFDPLLIQATGVGPGTSLADKVSQAQAYYEAGDVAAACETLSAYINQINALSGKRHLSTGTAAALLAGVQSLMTAIGCD